MENMQTKLQYLEDFNLSEALAKVISVAQENDRDVVVLDQTMANKYMLGLKRGTVKLARHSKKWKGAFEKEARKLHKVFGKDALDIQHVGSTAILGIPAKPIIDMAVLVLSFKKTKRYIPALKKLGYVLKENDMRSERLFFTRGPEEKRTHYLHIGEVGSGYIKDMLFFRDYMLTHKRIANEYAELKKTLARRYADRRDLYTKEKKRFIDNVAEKEKV